mmetsp:Transcript_17247/g.50238  ORF Transcript_17247/g.50238 Transcript_17247/m.50238 type:complete len:365 (-) Transcript_17247:240-1334(-)
MDQHRVQLIDPFPLIPEELERIHGHILRVLDLLLFELVCCLASVHVHEVWERNRLFLFHLLISLRGALLVGSLFTFLCRRAVPANRPCITQAVTLSHIRVHVQEEWKPDLVIQFDSLECLIIQVESLQLQCEDVGQFLEAEPFYCIQLAARGFAKVLVVSVKSLGTEEGLQGLSNRVHGFFRPKSFDLEGHVQELGHALGLVGKSDRLQVVHHFPLVQIVNQCRVRGIFERFFQAVEKHAAELLHVLLLERLGVAPAKGLGEGLRPTGSSGAELHPTEQALELVRNAFVSSSILGFIVLPRVECSPELGGHVQRLQQRVEVARRALVRQATERRGCPATMAPRGTVGARVFRTRRPSHHRRGRR